MTFGAPKFTDLDGSAEVLRRRVPLLRVNNRADPVPRLPPWPQYIQAGAEVFRQGGERRKVQCFFLKKDSSFQRLANFSHFFDFFCPNIAHVKMIRSTDFGRQILRPGASR